MGDLNWRISSIRAGNSMMALDAEGQELQKRMDELTAQYGDRDSLLSEIGRESQLLAKASKYQTKQSMEGVGRETSSRYDPEFEAIAGRTPEKASVLYAYINNPADGRGTFSEAFQKKGYDLLSDEERAVFNYHYNKGGDEEARKYLDSIQESLTERVAVEAYKEMEGKWLREYGFGIEAGLDQFTSGIASLFSDEAYIPPSYKQIASSLVREDLKDTGPKLPEFLGGGSLGQVGYDVITTGANMAPSILTSAAVGLVNPGAGAAAGAALMGASATGGAYAEALNSGYSKEQARTYSALVGAAETGLQYLLGGVEKLGGKLSGHAAQKLLDKVDNVFGRLAVSLGGSAISEGSEEYLQEVLDPVFRNIATGSEEEIELLSEEALYSAFLGALTGGVMDLPGSVSDARAGRQAKISAENGTTEESQAVPAAVEAEADDAGWSGSLDTEEGAAPVEIETDNTWLKEAAQKYGDQAQLMVDTFREGQDEGTYDVVFGLLYDMGKEGVSLDYAMQSEAAQYLDESQRSRAYQAGRAAGGFSAIRDSGERVKVARVAESAGGKLTLELEDGRVLDSGSVILPTESEAQVYRAVADLEVDTTDANALISNFKDGSVDGVSYAQGIRAAFRAGSYSIPRKEMLRSGSPTAALSPDQRNAAYELGQKYAKAQAESPAPASAKGVGTEGKVHFGGDTGKLTKRQRASLSALEKVAQALGTQIHIFESQVDDEGKRTGANGWYDTKTSELHIDLYAGLDGEGTMLFTAAHELTHFIKQWSPVKFKKLADFLMREYGKQGMSVEALVEAQQAKAKRAGRELSYDEAYEEMVADSMEAMLSDGHAVEKLAKLRRQDESLWEKLRDGVRNLVRKIRKAYEGLRPDSAEGRFVAEMKDSIEELQNLFVEGLADAGENYRGAEKNTAQEGGGTRYQLRGYSQHQKDNWKTSKRIVVYESGEQLEAFIKESLNNKTMDKKMYLGAVPEGLAEDILANTGLDVEGYNLSLGSYEIRKIIKDHGNEGREATRGQRAITAKDFSHIMDVVQSPVSISLSENRYNGKPAIIFTGDNGGRMNVVAVVSDKRLDLFIQTMYVNVKKGNLSTPTGDRAPANTPEANNGTVSFNESISGNNKNVNIKFSERDPEVRKVYQALERENEGLREDVKRLRELVRIQHTVTNGTKFTHSSVEKMAAQLMKDAGAKGDRKELTKLLSGVYEYIAGGEELTWEGVREQAEPAAQWLVDHVEVGKEPDPYAAEILKELRGARIKLNEVQKAEVTSAFGSYNDFRKATFGSFILASEHATPLDVVWQDLAAQYPDVFDAGIGDADMPLKLVEIVDSLRDTDIASMEFAYSKDAMVQDMVREVYDGYWRVSTLKTAADVAQRKINELKSRHAQDMAKLRQKRQKVKNLEAAHRAEIRSLRKDQRAKLQEQQAKLSKKYQESRKKATEGRNKTAMRHKIQRKVKQLNDLLLKEDKDHHVPDGLKRAVVDALEAVNMDTFGAEERLAKYDKWIAEETDPEKRAELQASRDRITATGDKFRDKVNGLKAAYDTIRSDPKVDIVYDDVISRTIGDVSELIGETPLGKMSMEELEAVYEMFKMLSKTVSQANKAFKLARGESIAQLGSSVIREVAQLGEDKEYVVKMLEGVKKFGWNNLKPIYAFKAIGSDTLTELFQNVRSGEDTWAVDIREAKAFLDETARKHGFDQWDAEAQHTFKSNTGKAFSLSLEQIMSLYAYSKREQAWDHLTQGGFVFDSAVEVVEKKNGLPVKYKVNTASAFNLNQQTVEEIISKLTPEQKAFVDEMQKYLSETMGEKGNEVSQALYDVRLFKEKNYFPLKSANQFTVQQTEDAGEVRIKNSGFSKKVVKHANNPVILSDFMSVWANHVNDMSMYHAFVLPLEDFNRVFGYKQNVAGSDTDAESVKQQIQNVYGAQAGQYIKSLLTDLNGGVRTDNTTDVVNRMIGKFKKGATLGSLSVVAQQPSAIVRAMALVDAKYFVGQKVEAQKREAQWEELKKYAPVAIIKEMGYFDTNMGRSTVDYMTAKRYDTLGEKAVALVKDAGYRDEKLSRLPALADEFSWGLIWEAVKRETLEKNRGLYAKDREAFLQLAGKRFTEVVTTTQVYDSVLSRSANMRSRDTGMKMLTAFMAEPTTSINMLADALIQGKRGNRSYARRAIGSVVASNIVNAALASIVYAMRDDDEDETFWEKYVSSATGMMLDSAIPLTYIPFARDIWSIVRGYDVERSDMAVVSDLWNAWQKLFSESEDVTGWDKFSAFTGDVSQMFGIPLKNIFRDAEAVYDWADGSMKTLLGEQEGPVGTSAGLGYAALEGVTGSKASKQQQLYEALLKGDEEHAERVMALYEDESAVNSAIRKALRENDPRIREAAVALNSADLDEYLRIANEIVAEGRFSKDNVSRAIRSEADYLLPDEEGGSSGGNAKGLFAADDFVTAIRQGDNDLAQTVMDDLIETMQANGKTAEEAQKSFASSARSDLKVLYMNGEMEADEVLDVLVDYCGETTEAARERLDDWDFESGWGFTYSDQVDAYRNGQITASELRTILMEDGGKTGEEADLQIQAYDWEAEVPGCDGITAAAIKGYNENCKSSGISKSQYYQVWKYHSATDADVDENGKAISGSKKEKVLEYIDGMNLTDEQKDSLYYAFGWAESTIDEAPWH